MSNKIGVFDSGIGGLNILKRLEEVIPNENYIYYQDSYNKAANRLVREFSISFCKDDGSIDWERLVEFNSGD